MIEYLKACATLAWLSFRVWMLERRRQRLMAQNEELRAELAWLMLAEQGREG